MRRTIATLVATSLAVASLTACTDQDSDAGGGGPTATTRASGVATAAIDVRLAASLRPFDACDKLLDHVRSEASAHGGALGSMYSKGGFAGDEAMATGSPVRSAAPAADAGAAVAESGAGPVPTVSGTNVQEAGVDEPDTVKTDGKRIFALAQGRLQVLEVDGGRHELRGSLLLPGGGGQDLLLAGDSVLVRAAGWNGQDTVLTLVDVSDSRDPRVLSTLEVDGQVVGARMVGDVARVVTSAGPQGFVPGVDDQAQVKQSTIENWLPGYRLDVVGTKRDARGVLPECDRVHRPAEFSGLGTISVLTFDLSEGLGDGDAVSVLADGQTVYASATALYVATTRVDDVIVQPQQQEQQGRRLRDEAVAPPGMATAIHKFDITGTGPARHVASGRVRGHLLNQFSMSEHDGRLRVATTDGFPGFGGFAGPEGGPVSESFVTVLEHRDAELVQAGQVGNLGRGERIYAVRFLGEVGYVVTFRQTDPLYTIDLSDPSAPRVAGELKIAGYSAYLHPIGDNLLIGVGQDADERGRTKGLQVSLFDVSDPASPKRIQQGVLPGANSEAEWDHHAFLWWPATSLAVIPYQRFQTVAVEDDGRTGTVISPGSEEVGALGMVVTRDAIREAGRVIHPTGQLFAPGVRRSLVVGDTLFTLSDTGLKASGLSDFAERAWLPFTS